MWLRPIWNSYPFGGYGERVESPDQVGPALERALHAVKKEGRQAVLNMICKHA